MQINFNSLPSGRPVNLPEKGTYYATIERAEMKLGKDTTKPPYLNMLLSLTDKEGKKVGNVYDMLAVSDSELIQYKLARFLVATGLTNLQNFTLADLAKLVPGKQFIVDITREEKDGYAPRAVVNLFSGSIYYPMTDAADIFQQAIPVDVPAETVASVTPANEEDTLTIDAEDAADVPTVDDSDEF